MKLGEIKKGYAVVPFLSWNKAYFNTETDEKNIYSDVSVAKEVSSKLSEIGQLYSVYSASERRLIY